MAPLPDYHWCPGEFWDPGWGNNWDGGRCHDDGFFDGEPRDQGHWHGQGPWQDGPGGWNNGPGWDNRGPGWDNHGPGGPGGPGWDNHGPGARVAPAGITTARVAPAGEPVGTTLE